MGTANWSLLESDAVTEDHLVALMCNEIAGIRIPGFVDADRCRTAAAAVEANGFDYYEELEPPLGRIGITQYENRATKAEYFGLVPTADRIRRAVFREVGDPLEAVVDVLRGGWSGGVGPAQEPGWGPYFGGLVRVTVGGIGLHCDWGPQDGAGWRVADVTGQLAWNIYYGVTESGGETTTYRQPWSEELQASHADPTSLGYFLPRCVMDAPRQVIDPRPGELVFINSRNLHTVAPTSGSGRRISASSFAGWMPDGSLGLWS